MTKIMTKSWSFEKNNLSKFEFFLLCFLNQANKVFYPHFCRKIKIPEQKRKTSDVFSFPRFQKTEKNMELEELKQFKGSDEMNALVQ